MLSVIYRASFLPNLIRLRPMLRRALRAPFFIFRLAFGFFFLVLFLPRLGMELSGYILLVRRYLTETQRGKD